jgi:drug/metabolite transporter (DMT)-like permease
MSIQRRSDPYNRRVDAIGPGLGAFCALGSGLTWAVINLMVRALAPAFNSVSINALRTTAAGGLLVAWTLATGGVAEFTSVSASHFLLLTLSIVASSAIGDTIFFESTPRVGLAPALTISMTYPLMAALFAVALLGEAVTARMLTGAVLTLSGLAMIVASRGGRPAVAAGHPAASQYWLGFACAIVASIAWAVSAVLLKAPLRDVDAVTAQALRMPISGLLLFATPWARGTFARVTAGGPALLWRVALLSVITAASSTLFTAGIKYAGVTVGSVLSSTAPMWAVPLGFLGLGERLSTMALVGVGLTVVGIIVLQL